MEKSWYEKLLEAIFGTVEKEPVKKPVAPALVAINFIPLRHHVSSVVTQIQKALKVKGYDIVVDGDFGPRTELVISRFQKDIGLNGSGALGPITIKRLGFVVVRPKPTKNKPKAPWFWKLKKYEGENESNPEFNKEMSSYWSKVGLPGFKSIVGSPRAWCGLFIAVGLVQAGVSYQKTGARAKDWDKYGMSINWKLDGFYQGAIVRINSRGDCKSSKGNHVTLANGDCTGADLMKPGATFSGFGGNQGNKAKVSTYKVNRICSVKWPSETFVPSKVTLSINCSNGKTADNESTR